MMKDGVSFKNMDDEVLNNLHDSSSHGIEEEEA